MGSPVRVNLMVALAVLCLAPALDLRAESSVRWRGEEPGGPRPERVILRCPAELSVACDGAGNLADRDAWLAEFVASATGGCDPVDLSFRFVSGDLISTTAYPDFADLSAWTLNGATGVIPNPVDSGGRPALRLTDNLSQSGSAFLSDTVTLAGDASFSATFAFRISNPIGIGDADGPGADGLTFVLQTVSDTAGGVGGGLGYQGIAPSVAVELDTYNNGAWDRNDGNHVGIDIDGDVASIALVPVTPRFNDGAIWHVWVDYDGPSRLLEVRVDRVALRPPAPLLQEVVDVVARLGGTEAFIGFTSGTGAGGGWHDILSFYFSNTRDAQRCGDLAGVQTVIATAADACGDVVECAERFVIEDREPPILSATPLEGCFSSAAEAEAAALAVVFVEEPCAQPVELVAIAGLACDGSVTVQATDACGNVASLDLPARFDAEAPEVTPTDPRVACGGAWLVAAEGWDGAMASPSVSLADDCGPMMVTNDRTAGGADATDRYPCGRTVVRFTATDACGRSSACDVQVMVEPAAAPPSVGPTLRVSKDSGGHPLLDWSLFGPVPAEALFVVKRLYPESAPSLREEERSFVADTRWREPTNRHNLAFYDIRTQTCDAIMSAD